MTTHVCRFILSPTVYCGKSLGYTIKRDPETGRNRRYYQSFCAEHTIEVARMDADE